MNTQHNPPAFPVVFDHTDCISEQEGMSLRDYFAAKTMQGLMSRPISDNGVPLGLDKDGASKVFGRVLVSHG